MTKRAKYGTVTAAAGLVFAVVAAALYANGRPAGNGAAVADSRCAASLARAASLQPLARGDIAAMASATDPKALSHLEFDAPGGERISLADRAGKALLVNLWATWCAPCREEMPTLDALQAAFAGESFEVVAINVDTGDPARARAFLDGLGIGRLGFYRDGTLGVFNALKREGLALGLPVTLLVDETGCLLAGMNGPAHWSGDDALAYIAAALAGRVRPNV